MKKYKFLVTVEVTEEDIASFGFGKDAIKSAAVQYLLEEAIDNAGLTRLDVQVVYE